MLKVGKKTKNDRNEEKVLKLFYFKIFPPSTKTKQV